MLIKSSLNPTPANITAQAEIKWVNIHPHENITVLVGVAYHPDRGGSKNLEVLCNSISQIDNDNVLLMGDFNLRDIDWAKWEATSASSTKFLDTLEENELTQLVDKPTRGKNLIDLVITGLSNIVDSVSVEEPFSTSDHRRTDVVLKLRVPRIEVSPRKVYLYSKGDYEGFNEEVRNTNWERTFQNKSVNQQWCTYKQEYYRLRDKYVPHKLVKPNQRQKIPWLNYRSVKRVKKKKRKAFVNARKTNLNAYEEMYNDVAKDCKYTMERAQADYENKLVDQIPNNPKRFFNYVRNFSRTSSTIDCLNDNGNLITDDNDKANLLNDFFTSVMTNEPDDDFSHSSDSSPNSRIFNIHFTPKEVREKLKNLKRNKSGGMDDIHVNVLKEVLDFDVPLALLFNNSLQTGQVPQDWKDANVTPLHKKGSRMSTNNYRPVSLTSQICKLMERLIQDSLWKHIHKNKLISCHQHGFQKGCSCITQLLECLADWVEAVEDRVGVNSIYLDFAKAFDTVPHKRLLSKLKAAGIDGKVLKWLETFLVGRRQRVVLRNGVSRWSQVTSGVPQGSILGPLLFLLYVNDIPDSVLSTAKLFADDTKLYSRVRNQEDCNALQADLNALAAWSRKWLLRFNETKCVVLKIHSAIQYVYTLNGTCLSEETSQKDLGITISHDLLPATHITNVVKKANSRIHLIKRCFSGFTRQKVLTLYTSLVRPLFEYGSPVWNPWHQKDIDLLQKAQNRCLKLCTEPIELESLAERREKADLVETYKYMHGMYKTPADRFFTSSHTQQLRGHSKKIFKRRPRTNIGLNFFSHRVVDTWNALSDEAVTSDSVDSFKLKISSTAVYTQS